MSIRLGVNIDHVATIRKARGEKHPEPYITAKKALEYGADSITIHLREDRRHINDNDLKLISSIKFIPLNLEMASNSEMLKIAIKYKPDFVCIVPEKRQELTTEGGLALRDDGVRSSIGKAVERLSNNDIRTALFIDPEEEAVRVSKDLGATAVELHTGEYANADGPDIVEMQLDRLERAALLAAENNLGVHAGHGLTYENVKPVAAIATMEELNIGHSVISRAVLVGLSQAVKEMRLLIAQDRGVDL